MNKWSRRVIRSGDSGFTVVEVLVYLLVASLVLAAVYQLLIGQTRMYSKQRELQDVRSTIRGAANFLAWELRQASATGGDLYSITQDSFTIRSVLGTGYICAEHEHLLRYGLWGTAGEFYGTSNDSALVLAVGDPGAGDDVWKVVAVDRKWSPGAAGVPNCFWGDTIAGRGRGVAADTGVAGSGRGAPDIVLEVSGDMDDVYMGAPVRTFRRVQYGMFQQEGRWWLGRRVGAAASFELLTGPLRAPADTGLMFTYYDVTGDTTSDPTAVRMVDIRLRGESLGAVPRAGQAPSAQTDTLTFRVSLRG